MREERAVRKRVVAWVVGLATALVVGAPARAHAQLPKFGMIGLAEGQLAVLNLVLVNSPNRLHPGCRVTASFVGSEGEVFLDRAGHPITGDFRLRPQIAAELRLRSDDIWPPVSWRTPIRAVLTPAPNTTTPSDCRGLMANVEMVNANGQTAALQYGHCDPNPPGPINPGSACHAPIGEVATP